jgi:hypothetical protein
MVAQNKTPFNISWWAAAECSAYLIGRLIVDIPASWDI